MLKAFYQKHNKVINVGGMILLGAVCFKAGKRFEGECIDRQLIYLCEAGQQGYKVVGNMKYTLSVTKNGIE